MRALLIQHGCEAALEVLPVDMEAQAKVGLNHKAHSAVILCLGNKVLREVTEETTAARISEHIDEFNKIVLDLANIKVKFEDKDLALLLPTSLPASYEHFVDTLLYGREALTLEDVMTTQNSKEIKERNCPKNNCKKSTGYVKKEDQPSSSGSIYDDSEVMTVMSAATLLDLIMGSGCSYHMTYRQGRSHMRTGEGPGPLGLSPLDILFDFLECDGGSVLLGDNRECKIRGVGKVRVQLRDGSSFVLNNVRYIPELKKNLISLGTLEKEGYTVKMQSGKVKVINGSRVILSGTRRAKYVYSLDGHAVAGELNVSVDEKDSLAQVESLGGKRYFLSIVDDYSRRVLVYIPRFKHEAFGKFKEWKQLVENQTGRTVKKLRTDNGLDFRDREFEQLCIESGITRHLTVFGCHNIMGKLEPRAVKCVLLGYPEGVKGYRLYRLDCESPEIVTSRNVVFNESVMYKDTLKDSGVGDQETDQTPDLTNHQLTRDREPRTRMKPLRFQDESNMAAYAFAAAKEEDTHEPLTYQEAVACEDNSKWKASMEEDMDSPRKNKT
ncbi:retrotransposon protein, putative, ty1-copia subclass [Tanacetum coccineum]|uniref:Retrotransposon protein, putative, ty1-copia subclass n=1 Tax=Tanacetum coccineum TaxID=301880 RepID=A0ABQ5A498_9ASTR